MMSKYSLSVLMISADLIASEGSCRSKCSMGDGPGSEGIVLASGYRLAPKGYSRQPVVASEAAHGLGAWLWQTTGEFRATLSSRLR